MQTYSVHATVTCQGATQTPLPDLISDLLDIKLKYDIRTGRSGCFGQLRSSDRGGWFHEVTDGSPGEDGPSREYGYSTEHGGEGLCLVER